MKSDLEEVHYPTFEEIKKLGLNDEEAKQFYNLFDKFVDYKTSKISRKKGIPWKVIGVCAIASIAAVVITIGFFDALNNPNGIIRKTLPEIKIGQ